MRRRKWLIVRRWCFFLVLMVALLSFALWMDATVGSLWNVLAWVLLLVWLLTVFQVLYCKFFPPIITPLMLRRYLQQRRKGEIHFEWQVVPINDISPLLVNAVNVAENKGLFLYSRGFLFIALRKAYLHNQTSTLLRGGSTIVQQTAKNCFLPHSRTLLRKVVEAYYVWLIELFWSKKRIMECYLNIIEFGDGIYGCEAACQHYFHHSAKSLTEHEAAMLAASLPSPRLTNPASHTPNYDRYTQSVLNAMHNHEDIDWNIRYEDMDMQKLEEGNRGLLFFVKWWCLQQIRQKVFSIV